ncbi:response regulator transcription factor [Chamaesiphon polymorphus]|uniref:Response regulatory domain-containing protein n=1 Tax=Chamaesiphon polymorphus CCALA 037 TaxID=2107692 RepID=A0A2T1GK14_9CYAN|nr:response regulator transcription factor [Chamaesiphon polymorphus]PSB58172.1 hypothetical protein C7B77_05705 [Chamaesiphon polymorphus CCALA 037]
MNRLLIAEDEARIAAFLEKGFRAQGFTTTVAKNGHEAIAMARSDDFDLLILDLGLPGKDGWQVLSEIRGRGERLRIIVLTAQDEVEDTVNALENGANDYVTKPFELSELLARVRVPNVVDAYIKLLRKKLGSDSIETVRGIGYRFRA